MPRPRSPAVGLAGSAVLLASLFCGCGRERLSPSPRDAELVEIGTEIQLVADDLALERMTALRRRLNPLTKHSRESDPAPRNGVGRSIDDAPGGAL